MSFDARDEQPVNCPNCGEPLEGNADSIRCSVYVSRLREVYAGRPVRRAPEREGMNKSTEVTIQSLVAGLRACADWLEANPAAPLPYDPKLQIFSVNTKAEVAALARHMGQCEKMADESMFRVVKWFGPFRVEGVAYREQICERIVVGTQTVAVPEVKAQPARIEVREVVEWKCGSLMASVDFPETRQIEAPEIPQLARPVAGILDAEDYPF